MTTQPHRPALPTPNFSVPMLRIVLTSALLGSLPVCAETAPLLREACIHGYPLIGMMQRMSAEALDPLTRRKPFNEFFHYRKLSTPDEAPFRAPNNDTLYSIAWVDLRNGPMLLSAPETKGRYYTAQVMNLYTDTIANLGARCHGTAAAPFAITGPASPPPLPSGLTGTVSCESHFAIILLRILVDGPEDVPAVNALQSQFQLTPLPAAGAPGNPAASLALIPLYKGDSPRDRLDTLNRLLRSQPVRRSEVSLMKRFAAIGIGPDAVPSAQLPPAESIETAEKSALAAIKAAGLTGPLNHGWRFERDGIGSYGTDYLRRASVWDGGPLANVPEESLYLSGLQDSLGKPLDGSQHRYRIRLPADGIPPVNFFWSITLYRMSDGMLHRNPINRYSIGNRTRGLVPAADGSLSLHLQPDQPDGPDAANWLPAPREPFYLVLRLYGPKPPALDGSWEPPAIEPTPLR